VLKYIAKVTTLNCPAFDRHSTATTQLSIAIIRVTESVEGLCHLLGEFTDEMLTSNRNLIKLMATLIEQCFHLLINSPKDTVSTY
jgi:hypothetical protein